MRFDERARRASQGAHRAVEVMEMSTTKTPPRLTRFDQYRGRTSRNRRIVTIVVGLGVPLLLLIGAVRLLGSDADQSVPADSGPGTVSPTPVSGATEVFEAPFTYTVPPDWTFSGDGAGYFSLETPGATGTDVIALSNVVAAASDCSKRPARGVDTSSEGITTWLSAHPALDATTPQPVRLGAATGSWMDVQLADDWDQTCGPTGLVLVTGHPETPQYWTIAGGGKLRLYVLDTPSGDTVTIVIDPAESASDFQSLVDEAAPVVESFEFTN